MIPTTGDPDSMFVGALSEGQHAAHVTQTIAQVRKPFKGFSQHWDEFNTMANTNPPQTAVSQMAALCLLTGARPVPHQSNKRVVMTALYNGSRHRHYNGYYPNKQDKHGIDSVLNRIGKKHGTSMQHQFTAAARSASLMKCRHDPSTFDVDTLRRFVGHAGKDCPIVLE